MNSPKTRISQILVIVLKNRSNEIRSNEILIRQELPVYILRASSDTYLMWLLGADHENTVDFYQPSSEKCMAAAAFYSTKSRQGQSLAGLTSCRGPVPLLPSDDNDT